MLGETRIGNDGPETFNAIAAIYPPSFAFEEARSDSHLV